MSSKTYNNETATQEILKLLSHTRYAKLTIVDGVMAINGALFNVLLNNNIPPTNAAAMLSDFISSYEQAWKVKKLN